MNQPPIAPTSSTTTSYPTHALAQEAHTQAKQLYPNHTILIQQRNTRWTITRIHNKPILQSIIRLLRTHGIPINDPYDLENWINDHATHTNLWLTDEFPKEGKE